MHAINPIQPIPAGRQDSPVYDNLLFKAICPVGVPEKRILTQGALASSIKGHNISSGWFGLATFTLLTPMLFISVTR